MRKDLRYLARSELGTLLDTLRDAGYRTIGPQLREGAIIYDELTSIEQLPQGVQDQQAPGHYRLEPQQTQRLFAWANGPQALKPFLFAPRETLWRSQRDAQGKLHFEEVQPDVEPMAIIGARPCDIAALFIHDKHFLQQENADPYYRARREKLLVVAVNCSHPADTCFCASTGDGPQAHYGFDIALTELDDGFLLEAHNQRGRELLEQLPSQNASEVHYQQAEQQHQQAVEQQQRHLPSRDLCSKLFDNLEHPQWQKIGERCLSCGNCTAVCPTCFCHSESELASLEMNNSEHVREWDSCFSPGHSYIHGITIRPDATSKYRQWMTHKLGSWHHQYGRSGCVGCGRCISWCPAAIDLTEEANAICGGGHE